jgi:hypothetical protein
MGTAISDRKTESSIPIASTPVSKEKILPHLIIHISDPNTLRPNGQAERREAAFSSRWLGHAVNLK